MALTFNDNENNGGNNMSVVNLSKAESVVVGQRINLSKAHPELKSLVIRLDWNEKPGITVDADLSAVCLKSDGTPASNPLVFYGNLEVPGVKSFGDNRTGEDGLVKTPTGGDEEINISLDDIDSDVASVILIASTHSEAEGSTQENPIEGKPMVFGRAADPFVVAFDNTNESDPKPLYTCDLAEEGSTSTCMEVAKVYRRPDGGWGFTILADQRGTSAFGLQGALINFGMM